MRKEANTGTVMTNPGWPVPLPEEFLLEIGRMTYLWTNLEQALNLAVSTLASKKLSDPAILILVNHAAFGQRRDTIGALCDFHTQTGVTMPDHRSLVSTLEKVAKERNRFAHDSLLKDPASGEIKRVRITARGKLSYGLDLVSVEEVRKASHAISEAIRDTIVFVAAVIDVLDPKPKAKAESLKTAWSAVAKVLGGENTSSPDDASV